MDTCCDSCAPAPETSTSPRSWWQDRRLQLSLLAGLFLALSLGYNWINPGNLLSVISAWVALICGAWQFAPEAIGQLMRGKIGISALMTISAAGAVALGLVEEAAGLAFLYSFAETLEHRAMTKAHQGLRALLELIPDTATIVSPDGTTRELPVKDIQPGDRLRLRAGQRLATDGVIVTGHTDIDVSAITGESIPLAVGPADQVRAGSINLSGVVDVEATAPGTKNSLTDVVSLVEQAQQRKGDRARIADRLARPLIPGVIILAVLVGVIGALFGQPDIWIERALIVLVAASPCALGISVPVTVISAIGAASKIGIIFSSGAAIEQLGAIKRIGIDKTGTLTRNRPEVIDVLCADNTVTKDDVLRYAASLEKDSHHPLAQAMCLATTSPIPVAHNITEISGQGMTGQIDGDRIDVGHSRWLDPGILNTEITDLEQRGASIVVVHKNQQIVGAIAIRDELRPEAPEVIHRLQQLGITVTMLTGDNKATAHALARQAGIDDVRAQLTPQDKLAAIIDLGQHNPIAMVGDGINDAPALAQAHVGIAMGMDATDVARQSADVAFSSSDLHMLWQAVKHARRATRIINQNLVISLLIISTLMPLAITGVLGLAAVVFIHEFAEVIVIANGLRAGRIRG